MTASHRSGALRGCGGLPGKGAGQGGGSRRCRRAGTGTAAASKAFLDMLGVFAEFETNLRRERQLEGLPWPRREGVYRSRKPSIDPIESGGCASRTVWDRPLSPAGSALAGLRSTARSSRACCCGPGCWPRCANAFRRAAREASSHLTKVMHCYGPRPAADRRRLLRDGAPRPGVARHPRRDPERPHGGAHCIHRLRQDDPVASAAHRAGAGGPVDPQLRA